ncbi:unnamed protein product [Camellia sinensis]
MSEGNDLHRICEGYDLHWICEGNDLAAAISVGVTTVVLRRGRLVKRAYDALLLDAGGTLLQLVKPVEEIYASIGRKYEEEWEGKKFINGMIEGIIGCTNNKSHDGDEKGGSCSIVLIENKCRSEAKSEEKADL